MKKIILMGAIMLCASLAVSACSNTLDGAGRDIERAGEKIQGAF